MILGKFMPPHLGHQYLADFASYQVQRLYVVVATLESEPIPGRLRLAWMEDICPRARVIRLTDDNPQYPEEDPDFWNIWRKSLERVLPEPPDMVFASENYGFRLAEELGATYVPVDHARELVPISGTKIRQDPLRHWAYLPPPVRPYFVRRVAVAGPESTGKSVLARRLAHHYHTVYVHEYARGLVDLNDGRVDYNLFPRIARGQASAEEAMARQANRILFCDTDLITTALYADMFFGRCPGWIRREAERRASDLYLVLEPDAPFVPDPQRFFADRRYEFLEGYLAELDRLGRSHVRIGG
ncbi:MAG: AAA family ATPase, partial [Proteobacteria bacterium]|nr:AAA family ATPase [Pseudomonadota bacterium]